ncbi:glycosyltransferase [Burkholderia pseudomultivorans]|nr:glycosyltransferase [Burkholderia pseudomultivorans]
MKIAFVISGLGVGGAETQILALTRELAVRGHRVTIFSMTGECAHAMPVDAGVSLVELREKKNLSGLMRITWKLLRVLRTGRFDVVHAHMFHANIITRLIRPWSRCPVLITSAHSNIEGGRFRTLMYRWTDRLTDFTTNVSAAAVQRYVEIGAAPARKIGVMYNGIDVSRFRRDADSRRLLRTQLQINDCVFVVLAVGRLIDAKNYPLLIRAFERVHRSIPHARLLIAGDGPLGGALREMTRECGLTQSVTFLGVRKDVSELMNVADVFVLSSNREGFGLVVAEAMATEIPVVATNAGGLPEVVGDAGKVVPMDNEDALVDAITCVVRMSPEARALIGLSGRAHVEKLFAMDSVLERWLELYRKLSRNRSCAV